MAKRRVKKRKRRKKRAKNFDFEKWYYEDVPTGEIQRAWEQDRAS